MAGLTVVVLKSGSEAGVKTVDLTVKKTTHEHDVSMQETFYVANLVVLLEKKQCWYLDSGAS